MVCKNDLRPFIQHLHGIDNIDISTTTANSIDTDTPFGLPGDGNIGVGETPQFSSSGLMVFETKPIESKLDIFYETSTGGLIKDNGIQRFATGGMVQGQDNVPIMAQAGEFIMQRSAVQNIGVQNLAEMNRNGTSNGVTVNIQGNMIGNDEFVRDTLIPQLTKVSSQNLA